MNTTLQFWVTSPELLDAALEEEEGGTLIARKVGEAVQSTLGAVVGAIDIPLGESLPGETYKEAASEGYQCFIQFKRNTFAIVFSARFVLDCILIEGSYSRVHDR